MVLNSFISLVHVNSLGYDIFDMSSYLRLNFPALFSRTSVQPSSLLFLLRLVSDVLCDAALRLSDPYR